MIKIIDLRKEAEKDTRENELLEKIKSRGNTVEAELIKKVGQIVEGVKERGNFALLEYTEKFDSIQLKEEELLVKEEEKEEAYRLVDADLIRIIKKVKSNIEDFYSMQKENSWISADREGVLLGQLVRPLESIGVYVPGGRAPLISSVLMNVIPANVAGVKKITMVTPPNREGLINPAMLVAAVEAGVDVVYRVGGAQAISALAFGTESVDRVDKIFGPGNIYVTTAKRLVYGYCDIDMFAGPSEIVVLADESAKAAYVAADLLSQAEHDTLASSILITTSACLAQKVKEEIKRQYDYLDRKEIIKESLRDYGAIIVTEDMKEAIELVNLIAPEHLELCTKDPFDILGSIKNAGAIFLGHYSSESVGDYWAGPSHVLPTGGTARYFSCLNLGDFMKKSSIISYSKEALYESGQDIIKFAQAEELAAHANAIRVRLEEDLA